MIFGESSGGIIGTAIFVSIFVIFIWVHGVMGINTLLRYNMRSYKKYVKYFYTIYIGIPVLGIFGFWSGLKE
ncbi:MAG: hypothetical protein P8M50_03800 [Paracoccaceae bacterium]|nr:hypothetical protein [Paracoccaceae bacterium]